MKKESMNVLELSGDELRDLKLPKNENAILDGGVVIKVATIATMAQSLRAGGVDVSALNDASNGNQKLFVLMLVQAVAGLVGSDLVANPDKVLLPDETAPAVIEIVTKRLVSLDELLKHSDRELLPNGIPIPKDVTMKEYDSWTISEQLEYENLFMIDNPDWKVSKPSMRKSSANLASHDPATRKAAIAAQKAEADADTRKGD